MSVLSASAQQKVEDSLISESLVTKEQLNSHKAEAAKEETPVLTYLVHKKIISSEQLTKITAKITKVPYVNLNDAKLDPKVLALLPQELAERYMAVPLGEMKNRLAIAMLDSENVQAVDFLSSKLGRPLSVFVATEEGIETY